MFVVVLLRIRFLPSPLRTTRTGCIPIPRSTVELLGSLLEGMDGESPFILLTPERNKRVLENWKVVRATGEEWTHECMVNNALREFRRHAKAANLKDSQKLTIHTSLRKSCGVNWANHLPIHVTQAYMGHSSIKTTQEFYLTVGDEFADKTRWIVRTGD